MQSPPPILLIILVLLTLAVLIAGIIVMARGGKINEKLSNKLMIARVAMQFLVIIVVCVVVFLSKHG